MSLTRTHLAFLAIISIFTGLIGPGTHADTELLSYLMTDMRWIAYGLLLCLIFAFASAAVRKWSFYRISGGLIFLGIATLGVLTFMGDVASMKTGEVASGLSWGWVFLIVGALMLGLSYRQVEQSEEETNFSEFIDTVIGMVGGFALACIAGILILSSLSFFSHGQNHAILENKYSSGEILTLSGGLRALEGASLDIPYIAYDRGEDSLFVSMRGASGSTWRYMKAGATLTGTLEKGLTPMIFDSEVYGIDARGYGYSGSRLILGSQISEGEKALIYQSQNVIHIVHKGGKALLDFTGSLTHPLYLSEDRSTLVWAGGKVGTKYLYKNGIALSGSFESFENITLSKNGQTIMILASSGSEKYIYKNSTLLGALPKNTLTGSYISNGTHTLFVTESNGIKKVYHDMGVVSRDLQEVRETFLEKDGGSYAYFGRPIGDTKYCLFTRYKGNICGLEGYMNPSLGADGGSILFAGKKDGIWNIYRNTDIVVRNTRYNPEINTYDYAYFDTTNPRTYLFIERESKSGLYIYRKNGNILPGTWNDVGTDVIFGYDNHIITTARDDTGWRIIEL